MIPTFTDIKRELKEGWQVFVSTLAISLYTVSNVFILGLFTNNTIVGYYSAGEKIVRAVQGLLVPFSQTLYPHISKLASESKEDASAFIRKIVKVVGVTTFLLSLALFIFAPQISNIILGSQFKESIPVIQILSFLPFIIGLATVYANFFLLAFGYIKIWSNIIIFASCVSLLGAMIFVYMLGMKHIGISINIFLTELIVLSLSFVAYIKISSLKFKAIEVK